MAEAPEYELVERPFIEQLRSMAGAIQRGIRAVEQLSSDEGGGLEMILRQAARSGDLPPALGDEDPALSWMAEQRGRWEGIRSWFLGTAEDRPTIDRLAEVIA